LERGEVGQLRLKLIVRVDSLTHSNDPAGFRSSDRCAPLVRAFCHWHGIPYEDTFVSIAVKMQKHSPVRAVGKRMTHGIDVGFGKYPIELDERVIEDIQIAAAGDFQNIICEAIKRECFSRNDNDWKEYVRKKVYDLRGWTAQEKKQKLEEIASELPSGRYAEARVFRTLHTSDKKEIAATLDPE
jgi:hypothetical protein